MADHAREQLVLEALLGHGEVDERRLRLHLGDVVRVGQLGLQVELEERAAVGLPLGVLCVSRSTSRVAELDDELAPFWMIARATTGSSTASTTLARFSSSIGRPSSMPCCTLSRQPLCDAAP